MSSKAFGSYLRGMSGDDVLERLGLMRRADEAGWAVPAIIGCAVGIGLGVGLGLAFAPKAGNELRQDVAGRLKKSDWRRGEGVGASSGTNVSPL
jgi:hypothetical protein